MRFAFLTPEYIGPSRTAGGLATYLSRMARLLVSKGHGVEVLVLGVGEDRVELDGALKLFHTAPRRSAAARIAGLAGRFDKGRALAYRMATVEGARALAGLLEKRHAEAPFDFVQSADYQAVGLAVKSDPARPHIIRCSSPIDIYLDVDGVDSRYARTQLALELKCLRAADLVYSPSRFTAEHYKRSFELDLHVVRPPIFGLDAGPRPSAMPLPPKYLLHFGTLNRRKGTPLMFEAFAEAVKRQPDMRLVVVGRGAIEQVYEWTNALGPAGDAALILYPLAQDRMYGVVSSAHAAILPSLVDNLPNTVIESLAAGTPVVGTVGTSIDELVVHGETGLLIEPDNRDALAEAMISAWNGEKNFSSEHAAQALKDLHPEAAYEAFMHICDQAAAAAKAKR